MNKSSGNDHTVEELITACKKGGERDQERLYKFFYGYAMSISRLYTYSTDDAVSILNDSFIKVFSILEKDKYKNTTPFKFFLRRIIINTAIDNYRKNLKHNGHMVIEEAEHLHYEFDIIENLNAKDILQLLDQIPHLHRLVFNLYEIQGFKHNEIAAQLNITESSSRVFLTRAKKKLRILIHKNI